MQPLRHRHVRRAPFEERHYLCRSGHDFGGCGRMAISAAPLEQIITEAVLHRLDTPGLHDALAGRAHDDQQAAALSEQIRADTEQLQELTDLYVARDIDAPEWKRARTGIEARRAAARKQLSRTLRHPAHRRLHRPRPSPTRPVAR